MTRFSPSPARLLATLLFAPIPACLSTTEVPLPPARAELAPPRPGPTASTPPAPVLVLEEVDGAQPARTSAVLAPAQKALGECHAGTGAVVRLRLASEGGRAHYAIEPATTLSSAERRCVLEALSTVDVDGISGDASPSARPSGFTALIRLEW
jgi:hypothetical protein